jgi:hypothetical protein
MAAMSGLCGDEMPDISDRRPTCILPAGHQTRVHRSAPPVHVWAPLFETGDEEACKECTHPWAAHSKEYGCELGWRYDAEGIASEVGCDCPLAHISLSQP